MENQAEFLNGLIVKKPREGAPDFVKGSISIKREELIQALSAKSDEWINLDIKESRDGKLYAQVNTWKPKTEGSSIPSVSSQPVQPSNDLPF